MKSFFRMTGLAMTLPQACAFTAALIATQAAASESLYGCYGLETNRELPSIEGKNGVFFRINTDLRMNHPFSDIVVAQMGDLAQALKESGTTLIFAPIPTKSVSMPDYLPDEARLYGFNLEVATDVHLSIINRLRAKGIKTVDIRDWLLKAKADKLAFFNSDFHWSAYGADLGAQGIAELLKAQPAYADLEKIPYQTVETGEEVAFSGMRRILQKRCRERLPDPVTMTYETNATTLDLGLGDSSEGGLDLFGDDKAGPAIALVGTSFSDSPINNFPGFIQQHTALEVVNYAITGGNQYGAITSYLTSDEFQAAPPTFLIWENPVYNNLAQYGDQPMRELIAAAGQTCKIPLPFKVSEDRKSMEADLSGFDFTPADSLFLNSAKSTGLEVDFVFTSNRGLERKKLIRRDERLRVTGNFYMPLSGLWQDGASKVRVDISAPFGTHPELYMCPHSIQKEKS